MSEAVAVETPKRRPRTIASRIYAVQAGDQFHLVEAMSKASALNHVVSTSYDVRIADQKTLVAALRDGVRVETVAA